MKFFASSLKPFSQCEFFGVITPRIIAAYSLKSSISLCLRCVRTQRTWRIYADVFNVGVNTTCRLSRRNLRCDRSGAIFTLRFLITQRIWLDWHVHDRMYIWLHDRLTWANKHRPIIGESKLGYESVVFTKITPVIYNIVYPNSSLPNWRLAHTDSTFRGYVPPPQPQVQSYPSIRHTVYEIMNYWQQ